MGYRQIGFSIGADNVHRQALAPEIKWRFGRISKVYAYPTSVVIGWGLAEIFEPDIMPQ